MSATGGKKHKWTRVTAKFPELMKHKGFTPWDQTKLKEITLNEIDKMARASKDEKFAVELDDYKVLSNGTISKPVIVKASGFFKQAAEKIKTAGGEAIVI